MEELRKRITSKKEVDRYRLIPDKRCKSGFRREWYRTEINIIKDICRIENDMDCKGDYISGDKVDQIAELEDKLESGQFIELPCKIGDTVYKVDLDRKTVLEGVVRKINYVFCDKCEKEYHIYADCGDRYRKLPWKETIIGFVFYPEKDWNISVFPTKEQAEAKLKELKEKI